MHYSRQPRRLLGPHRVGSTAATLVVPPGEEWYDQVLAWPVQPDGTPAATATALVLGCARLLAHSTLGSRR